MQQKEKAIAFLENEITKRKSSLQSEYYNHQMNRMYNSESYEYNNGEFEAWAYTALKRIYLLIVAYLELQGQRALLDVFKNRYEGKIEDETFMMKEESMPFDDQDVESLARLNEFTDFLMPFKAFSYSTDIDQKNELERLESILSETHLILTHNNVSPENEAKVYNEVRWLLQFTFPSVLDRSGARIVEKFKTYKPDILIPEIGAAVEYKFVKAGMKPANHLDELVVDANVYHKDPEYSNFFAVMYFEKNGQYTKESITKAWHDKDFPINWRLILPGL